MLFVVSVESSISSIPYTHGPLRVYRAERNVHGSLVETSIDVLKDLVGLCEFVAMVVIISNNYFVVPGQKIKKRFLH